MTTRVLDSTIRAAILAIKPWSRFRIYGYQPEVEPLDSSDVAMALDAIDLKVSMDRVRKALDQLVLSGELRAVPLAPLPGLEIFAREPRLTYLPITRTRTSKYQRARKAALKLQATIAAESTADVGVDE